MALRCSGKDKPDRSCSLPPFFQKLIHRYPEIVCDGLDGTDARFGVFAVPLADRTVCDAARLFHGRDIGVVLFAKAFDIVIDQKNSSFRSNNA